MCFALPNWFFVRYNTKADLVLNVLNFINCLPFFYCRRPQSELGEPDLGEGDLREFQAILAKDDTDMNEGDEEFMWSKRENLRSFPEALPKVLLSAPEKNYTGI